MAQDAQQLHDDALARALKDGLNPASPEELDASPATPLVPRLGPQSTDVLKEFATKAQEKGPHRSERDRMAEHLQHPFTRQTSDD